MFTAELDLPFSEHISILQIIKDVWEERNFPNSIYEASVNVIISVEDKKALNKIQMSILIRALKNKKRC